MRPRGSAARAVPPPIVEILSWVQGRTFPADRPLIDLSQAAPDLPPAPELIDHLQDFLGREEAARYGPVQGSPALREVLAERYRRRYGAAFSPYQVVITAGANQAFWPAVLTVARPGDEVILPSPAYFNHLMTLDMLGVRAALVPFEESRRGVPDPAAVAGRLTRRTRAIVIVSPNNPTGAVAPSGVLEEIADLATRMQVALILDETYGEFVPDPPHGLFARSDWADILIHITSFSKTLAIPGLRVGAMVAGPAVVSEILKVQDSMVICAPVPAQEAVRFGLATLDAWIDSLRRTVLERRDRFGSSLDRADTGWEVAADGPFFTYLRHPFPDRSAMEVCRALLEEQHLLGLPGSAFGPDQQAFVRLAVGNLPEASVDEVVARLREAAQ